MSASQISLTDLAQELSNVSGINIITVGETDRLVDVDIADEPFAKAMEKLSPSHLLVKKSVDNTDVISEVIFLLQDDNNTGSNLQEYLPTGEPAEGFVEGFTDSANPEMQEAVTTDELTEAAIEQESVGTEPVANQ